MTLIGPGGVGKTRLAMAIGEAIRTEFPGGVRWVDLSPMCDAVVAGEAITAAMARQGADTAHQDGSGALEFHQRRLLILDNCEHLLPEVARSVGAALNRWPDAHILATSRKPLRLRGEQHVPVGPLDVPSDSTLISLAAAEDSPAIGLFVARARLALPDFTLTPSNATTVCELCQRLDGLPLAIELVAARVDLLPPEAMLARLRLGQDLPLVGPLDAPPRHVSLDAAIDWSYRQLTGAEQAFFRQLAVLAGDWDLDAAAAVVSVPAESADVLRVLAALVDSSLVQSAGSLHRQPRFRMLETIRAFAARQLVGAGELEETQRRHAHHYLSRFPSGFLDSPGDNRIDKFRQIERELPNLRAALEWLEHRGDRAMATRIAADLRDFWILTGHLIEGRFWLERQLQRQDDVCLDLQACALRAYAAVLEYSNELEAAASVLTQCRSIAEARGHRLLVGDTVAHLGGVALRRHDAERAVLLLTESLEILADYRDAPEFAWALGWLGLARRTGGDLEGAGQAYDQAMQWARDRRDPYLQIWLHRHIAEAARRRGKLDVAVVAVRDALALSQALGDRYFGFLGVEAAALVTRDVIPPESTTILLSAASAARARAGNVAPPIDRLEVDEVLSVVRGALSPSAFASSHARGAILRPDDLLDLARRAVDDFTIALTSPAPVPPAPRTPRRRALLRSIEPELLTGREQDVLRLVAHGQSSKEIGRTLSIAERTVKGHVTGAMNKLGAATRAQAVALANERGLL